MDQTAVRASSQQRWLITLAPVIFLALWSAGFPIAKIGLRYATPLALLSIRFALSIGVLLVVCAWRRPAWPTSGRAWLHLIVTGFLVQVMYFGLSYLSLTAGLSSTVLALVVSLQPIIVGVLAPALVAERVGARKWIGLILGLVGAVGVIVARGPLQVQSTSGVLLAVGALIGITAAMLYEKRFGTRQDPLSANLIQYTVGLIFCAPLSFAFETMHVQWSGALIAALLYLVIGNSLIAVTLLLAMTRAGKVSQVASLFFFVPPGAALMSYLLLGEVMSVWACCAMAVAILGVAIATRSSRARERPAM
ncbi:drug/metabolite transporter (DMT)-like permease [Paraburkholderia sp. GAS199]|uniref:DMT family transporter n=1 Tax=Paraburkholderia sp. GAS199 TaxID=3035126 RepID=UPI003D23A432